MRTETVQDARTVFTLEDLAERFGAAVKGDSQTRIIGVESLQEAGPGLLSFVASPRLSKQAMESGASALIVPPGLEDLPFPLLVHANPYLLFARIARLFWNPPQLNEGIHATACVSEEAQLAPGVRIGPMAHVGPGSRIGAGSFVYAGAFIGTGVEIGERCLLYPRVTILDRSRIGNGVIIHSGTVIGGDGFGYAQDERGHHVKIPQTGYVQIDDEVEIGSNCCIDRATFDRTWIQRGTKIDNLVQIAHNVVVGEHSILVAQVGISGSTRLGRHVILAGQVGLADHIEIGDGVRVGAKSGVAHSIKAGQDMMGIPAMPQRQWFKTLVHMQRLSQYRDEIKDLRSKLQELETRLNREGQ